MEKTTTIAKQKGKREWIGASPGAAAEPRCLGGFRGHVDAGGWEGC